MSRHVMHRRVRAHVTWDSGTGKLGRTFALAREGGGDRACGARAPTQGASCPINFSLAIHSFGVIGACVPSMCLAA